MDIFSWLLVKDTVFGSYRWYMFACMAIFITISAVIIHFAWTLVKRTMKNPNKFAQDIGYDDFSEMRFMISRDCISGACLFIMFSIMVFEIETKMELVSAERSAMLTMMETSCKEQGGIISISCSSSNYLSVVGVLNFSHGGPIIQSSNST